MLAVTVVFGSRFMYCLWSTHSGLIWNHFLSFCLGFIFQIIKHEGAQDIWQPPLLYTIREQGNYIVLSSLWSYWTTWRVPPRLPSVPLIQNVFKVRHSKGQVGENEDKSQYSILEECWEESHRQQRYTIKANNSRRGQCCSWLLPDRQEGIQQPTRINQWPIGQIKMAI